MTAAARNKILVIDDEPQIRRFLRIALEAEDFQVIEALTGEDGLKLCANRSPQLIVLDLGLPDLDGQVVLTRLREWSTVPVIVLSVRSSEEEKIKALEAGANDYMTKPFGIGELVARIRVALRNQRQEGATSSQIECRDLIIDAANRLVTLRGRELRLSRKEYELLLLLARHRGKILTHTHILRELWGAPHEHDVQYLRVYIGQLRQKLGDDPVAPIFISTEPAVGYRFIA